MIDILEKLEEINTRIIRINAKIDQILSGGN
jgi:hypothetical protein